MATTESLATVGVFRDVPVGSILEPHFEAKVSNYGEVDWAAAAGVVVAIEEPDERTWLHDAWRDLMRQQPMRGIGGHVATYLAPGVTALKHLASDQARDLMLRTAESAADGTSILDAVIGHKLTVRGRFKPDDARGPSGLRSDAAVRVIGSEVIKFGQLVDHFGGDLALPAPLSLPEVARHIQIFAKSGALGYLTLEAISVAVSNN